METQNPLIIDMSRTTEVEYTHVARCQICGDTSLTSGTNPFTFTIEGKRNAEENGIEVDVPMDHDCEYEIVEELENPHVTTVAYE